MAGEPSAVLLIRVWLEGDEGAFRARLSGTVDATPEGTRVTVAASPGDVVVAVQRWLADFVRGGGDEIGSIAP